MVDPKQNAAGGSGAVSNAIDGGDYTAPVGVELADQFLTACAGDVAALYIAADGVAAGRTSNNAPTEILRAAVNIAKSLAECGGVR